MDNKKWGDMTREEKLSDAAWSYAENVKLGYWDTDRLKSEVNRAIDNLFGDRRDDD